MPGRSIATSFMITVFVLCGSSSATVAASQSAKTSKLVVQDKEVRNYEKPRQNGNRLSFCTVEGQCGKSVADEFCLSNEFDGALTFQRDRQEGHSAQLRFLRIKCWRSKQGAHAEKSRKIEEAGRQLISNSSAKSNRR
jgi:hypothetical protein